MAADLQPGQGLRSIVFRLPRSRLEALKELSRRSRITRSALLREAIADLLAAYAEELP